MVETIALCGRCLMEQEEGEDVTLSLDWFSGGDRSKAPRCPDVHTCVLSARVDQLEGQAEHSDPLRGIDPVTPWRGVRNPCPNTSGALII